MWTATLRRVGNSRPCDVPGLDGALRLLVATYRELLAGSGGGRTIFVAGDPGSGRDTLLHAFADALEREARRPVVLGGSFADGRYVPWEDGADRVDATLEESVAVGEKIIAVGEPLLPYAGLLRQLLAALELTRRTLRGRQPTDPAELAPRLLRELGETGPVVCIVDDADQASDGWWADLVLTVARRVARELQLLLVLGVDGPCELGAHEDDEPDSLFVARRLFADGLASWCALRPTTADELERWTGAASADVLQALLDVTGGRPDWTAQLWADWRSRGLVDDRSDGCWRFTADGHDRAIDEVDDALGARLKGLGPDLGLNELERARRLLACAALEGARFTADAVALALRRDRDEVIDDLDDVLGADGPSGLVAEAGSVAIIDEFGERHLWLYRFNAKLDWLAMRHHGLSDAQKHHLSRDLAEAMETVYGGQAYRVAHTLTRLYEIAGLPERARHFRRMGDIGVSRELVLRQAHAILVGPDPVDREERRRASQTLLAAASQLHRSGPFDDGLAFADKAHRLAALEHDEVRACFLKASHNEGLGDYEIARPEFIRVVERYRALRDPEGEFSASFALARIDVALGRHEQGRVGFARLLDVALDTGNRSDEAAVRDSLARIDVRQGEYRRARVETAAVLALYRELHQGRGEANTRRELGHIFLEQGEHAQARVELSRVRELYRELGDHQEADVQYALARVDIAEGAYEHARAELGRVLELYRRFGDLQGGANTRHQLARIDVRAGDLGAAREELDRVSSLYHDIGDRQGEANTLRELALVDVREDVAENARERLVRARELCCELGDRRGEADTRHELADLDGRLGLPERARAELARVVELRRELGDVNGEAEARAALERIG